MKKEFERFELRVIELEADVVRTSNASVGDSYFDNELPMAPFTQN